MAIDVYVYHMQDGFAYMGMLKNEKQLFKNATHRTLVDVAVIQTACLFDRGRGSGSYKDKVEAIYNSERTEEEMKINLNNVQAECMISIIPKDRK